MSSFSRDIIIISQGVLTFSYLTPSLPLSLSLSPSLSLSLSPSLPLVLPFAVNFIGNVKLESDREVCSVLRAVICNVISNEASDLALSPQRYAQ